MWLDTTGPSCTVLPAPGDALESLNTGRQNATAIVMGWLGYSYVVPSLLKTQT